MFGAVRQPVRAAQRLGHSTMGALKTFTSQDRARDFARDQKGTVAIIMALTGFIVVSMVGGAVDFGRAYSAQTKLQNALDSASLAASVAYQNDPNHNVAAALVKGEKFFTAAMQGVPNVTVTHSLDQSSKTVTMSGRVTVNTPFLGIVPFTNIKNIAMNAQSKATTTETVTTGTSDVELVMMLDTTGSMGWDSGNGTTKISALKTSATNFINILLPDNSPTHAKISLVPFAPQVKVDDTTASAVTGQPLQRDVCTQTQQQCVNTTCRTFRGNGTCRTWNQSCTDVCTQTQTQYLSRCMIDRTGSEAAKETSPGSGTYLPATWRTSLSSATTCTPSQKYVQLTSDKASLLATISSFTASGATAGALGTGWAWYALSPTFNSIVAPPVGTGSAKPLAYGTAQLKKIAVLMTDGEYNCGAAATGSCGDTDTATISQRAVDICTGMKNRGIEVYTVGFKLDNQTAINTLTACATDSNHKFLAEDAAQLEAAFREIAYRTVPLHIKE